MSFTFRGCCVTTVTQSRSVGRSAGPVGRRLRGDPVVERSAPVVTALGRCRMSSRSRAASVANYRRVAVAAMGEAAGCGLLRIEALYSARPTRTLRRINGPSVLRMARKYVLQPVHVGWPNDDER
jgi:hypothetical protein